MDLGTTHDEQLGVISWSCHDGKVVASADGRLTAVLIHYSGALGGQAHRWSFASIAHARKLWARQRAKETDFLHALIDAASERNPDDNPAELAEEAKSELEELVKTIYAMAE